MTDSKNAKSKGIPSDDPDQVELVNHFVKLADTAGASIPMLNRFACMALDRLMVKRAVLTAASHSPIGFEERKSIDTIVLIPYLTCDGLRVTAGVASEKEFTEISDTSDDKQVTISVYSFIQQYAH